VSSPLHRVLGWLKTTASTPKPPICCLSRFRPRRAHAATGFAGLPPARLSPNRAHAPPPVQEHHQDLLRRCNILLCRCSHSTPVRFSPTVTPLLPELSAARELPVEAPAVPRCLGCTCVPYLWPCGVSLWGRPNCVSGGHGPS
jgi:hypothetical protein